MQNIDMKKMPELEAIELVSDGWLKKYLLTYELPNGKEFIYESISRKDLITYSKELFCDDGDRQSRTDAVSIVAKTRDELVLIREFRYPLNNWCIALPAGLMEPNDTLLSCIERELSEETGYRICTVEGKPQYHALSQASYSSNGMTEESVHLVYVDVEKHTEPHPEDSEFIEVFTLPIKDVQAFLETNETPIGTRCQLVLESYKERS